MLTAGFVAHLDPAWCWPQRRLIIAALVEYALNRSKACARRKMPATLMSPRMARSASRPNGENRDERPGGPERRAARGHDRGPSSTPRSMPISTLRSGKPMRPRKLPSTIFGFQADAGARRDRRTAARVGSMGTGYLR
jgi:hypothetical protein